MGNNERRKAEIGLGLAAAGGEEQQVRDLSVCVLAIGKPGDVEKNERKLEWPPFRYRLCRRIACGACIAAPRGGGHCEVHEPECVSGNLVARQDINALEDALARGLHFCGESLRGLTPPRRQAADLLVFRSNPRRIENRQSREGIAKTCAVSARAFSKSLHAKYHTRFQVNVF